ncbi:MAG: metalloregulator ArsR/SmtB family transcription factor [Candidatus Latescibacterota bacterium]
MLKLLKALADETRLRIVRLLVRGPLNVHELMDVLHMGQSRISRHLRILAEAGLVESRREGTWIYYQASVHRGEPTLVDVLAVLQRHERSLARYTEDLQGLESVVERRRERTRSFFDSLTDPEALHQCLNGDFYRQVALSLMPEHCQTVLDLGTGSGLLLPGLLERAQRAIAVDSSRTMLDLARGTAGSLAARCDFRLGDLAHLPVADAEADAVMACMVLHHLSGPAEALAEARRALRPGGHIAIVDLREHQDERLRESMADLWLGFEPTQVEGWLRDLQFEVSGAQVLGPPGSLQLITCKGRKP